MLVATRDPPLHFGAHDASRSPGPHTAHATHGVARFMTVLQVVGSLLAIPVGLASGYSIYHANFSPEAQCHSLRAGIISMLDKNADASTLRLLVRRDVAAFEGSCGAVDPDAVAAFKTLLAAGKAPASAAAARATVSAQMAREPAHQQKAVKPPATKPAQVVTAAKSIRRDPAISDAGWLAAVRQALIHAPVMHSETADTPVAVARPVGSPVRARSESHVSAGVPAPALPPAPSVAAAPKPAFDAAHPVPPAPIPEAAPSPNLADAAQEHPRSEFSGLVAQIPLLGRLVERDGNQPR
jgi:hypothetical protein